MEQKTRASHGIGLAVGLAIVGVFIAWLLTVVLAHSVPRDQFEKVANFAIGLFILFPAVLGWLGWRRR